MGAIDEVLGRLKETDLALYGRAMRELYELRNGCHFDEVTAKETVAKMHSTDLTGNERRGEHWDYLQVVDAVTPHIGLMGDDDTMWDAYVASNMWWHDLGDSYRRRGDEDAEKHIIEDAITWAFNDDDAPEGKVWRYVQAMC